ncbi:B-cell receptor CD22-like [Battus philenor]|uniref:B-cell receptor CD22-like n=1 Tax=Battus philenor TaxID=42288 RepID=UPI0035D0423B
MDRRMRVSEALIFLIFVSIPVEGFVAGADGPVSQKEVLENGIATLSCDSTPEAIDDELMLLVWYKDNDSIYSYDARVGNEWCNTVFNATGRIIVNTTANPTTLTITALRAHDEALYHCRVEFLLSPTRNSAVNLTVVVLPSKPFFLDELGNTVTNKTRPYYEGDTLVLNCLVIGGRPPPKITWYSGETLVDATSSISDIPNVRQNELYLPLTRDNAETLSCRATNTQLVPPLEASLQIEMYLPATKVTIEWIQGVTKGVLTAGVPAIAQCVAIGSYPPPDLTWSLNHDRLSQESNQTWDETHQNMISQIRFNPTMEYNEAILTCDAINAIMPPDRNSKTESVVLNITFVPVVKIIKIDEGKRNEVVELDTLRLKCETKANPPAYKYIWYYNDVEIKRRIDEKRISSNEFTIEDVLRTNAGRYSCAARNTLGETRADPINITVLYPPECTLPSITFNKETLTCNVKALPIADTYFWHIQQAEYDAQHLTTGSASLSLNQVAGPFSESLNISCEAENGIASQEKPCTKIIRVGHLKPPQPEQCDLAFEYKEFQIRCVPVENATYYELSLWRLSTTNTSLVLDQKKSIEVGSSLALMQNAGEPWLVRGELGLLNAGDEAGAAACNRYGCSAALLLRPTDVLLSSAAPPWWKFFTGKDMGISVGVVLLVVMFVCSTILAVRLARRSRAKTPAPVIQVLQLDDVTRDYLSRTGDIHAHPSRSLRSNSSDYSDEVEGPLPDYHYVHTTRDWIPPPDVTLTLQRESAV